MLDKNIRKEFINKSMKVKMKFARIKTKRVVNILIRLCLSPLPTPCHHPIPIN